MKKLIELFNKKYGATYGIIDDSIDNEDVYKVYKMIKSLCSDDQEIMDMLNKIKLPNPRTASESIEKINAEHMSGEGLDDLIKYVDDNLPHYNETLIYEIHGEDFNNLMNNNYFNINALVLDETKLYVSEAKTDINNDNSEEFTFKFVYDKENDMLVDEDNEVYISNHKSYDGANFIENENSAVISFSITPMAITFEGNGYLKLYEVDKVELDNNCLSDDVKIKNSLTVGSRIGDIGKYSVAEGVGTVASGYGSHTEGNNTKASGQYSHAEGNATQALYQASHAEGTNTVASSICSHAEGYETIASGGYSHAEGSITKATELYSHAEGNYSKASGRSSHAEGYETIASGEYSHAEGYKCKSESNSSHAEGCLTEANNFYTHAEGFYTIAKGYSQHVQGKCNIEDTAGKYAHIVGNGESETERSNAHTLDWEGNAWYAGKLTQEGTPTEDKDLVTKKYVDEKTASIDTTINNTLPSNGLLTLTTDKIQTTTLATPTEIQLPEVTKYTEIHLFFTGVSGVTIGTGTTNVKWENQPTIEDNKTYELIFTHINDTIGWVAKTVVYS